MDGEAVQTYAGFQSVGEVEADNFRFDPLDFPALKPRAGWSVKMGDLTWKVVGRARQDGSFMVIGLQSA
jgi:hypothetical protein